MVLDSKKIEYERCDIASSEEDKKKMRDLMGDAKALPPQLFNGDQYLGVSNTLSKLYDIKITGT